MARAVVSVVFLMAVVGSSYAQSTDCIQGRRTGNWAMPCAVPTQKGAPATYGPVLPPKSRYAPQDVHGRPAVPIEIRPQPNSDTQINQAPDCARLAISPSLAERQQASVVCGRPIVGALPELPKPTPPETSPYPITTCDPGGCWDNAGARYNGSGVTMIRTDGKVCQKVGAVMMCN